MSLEDGSGGGGGMPLTTKIEVRKEVEPCQ